MFNLRVLRKKNGISMKQLGADLGMAESTVSLYENGKRNPDIQTMILIADYFNVSLDYLCGRGVDSQDESINHGLSDTELSFINDFRSLNRQGKEYMLQTMSMAVTIYKNDAIPDMENRA